MSNPKQTAVEWLIEQQWKIQVKYCNNELNSVEYSDLKDKLKQQARAMEREQIESAFCDGFDAPFWDMNSTPRNYYNKTYGKPE